MEGGGGLYALWITIIKNRFWSKILILNTYVYL